MSQTSSRVGWNGGLGMWVKLEDEYPPENMHVLIACDYGDEIIYHVAFWREDKRDGPMWYGYGSIPRSIIKAWQKIEPYA